jgi:hypothetical protein
MKRLGLIAAFVALLSLGCAQAQFITLGNQGVASGGGGGNNIVVDVNQITTGTTGLTCAITITTAHPNENIIFFAQDNNAGLQSVVSITDSQSALTFTTRGSNIGGAGGNDIFEAVAVASGVLTSDTITLTWSKTTSFQTCQVFSVSGALTSSQFDPHSGIPIGSAGPDPISITTTNSNNVIFGMCRSSSQSAPTLLSGWTILKNTSGTFAASGFQLTTSPQTALSFGFGTGVGTANGCVLDAIEST